ncbi:hypothetical protein PENANT_c001G03107 [Penicillium antarcticum]|uniref:Uncharacterized protein n=1 Tax=Penicillium antarcticum TaxID=416450 RepID=A0A1V6QNT1_9EURO|nr:hypothetical protein PENANT_c001G03107 [Penicillium antarcticum]
MFALFMNPARGLGPALGQKSRPGPSTGLENPAQNPTQPGLGPGWARVELGSAEVYSSILGSQQDFFPDIGPKISLSPPTMVVACLFLTPAKNPPLLTTTASASWAFAGLRCDYHELTRPRTKIGLPA